MLMHLLLSAILITSFHVRSVYSQSQNVQECIEHYKSKYTDKIIKGEVLELKKYERYLHLTLKDINSDRDRDQKVIQLLFSPKIERIITHIKPGSLFSGDFTRQNFQIEIVNSNTQGALDVYKVRDLCE